MTLHPQEPGKEWLYDAIAGVAITIIVIAFYFIIFHPEPFMINCGCGAQFSMCMQCINGGNLSAPICQLFVRGAP
jgi:hypothetical protein